ncbi:hypothetical protein ACET3Z_016486 [Daucus carota]
MQRSNGGGANAAGACASCRHQRKKCTEKCTLAPFFPVDKNREFQAVHKVFGVSNVTKILKRLNLDDRKRAADSLVWEAFSRQKDPILGPFGEYRRVIEELNWYKNEYQAYKSSLTAPGGLIINGLNETVMSNAGGMINYDANKYNIMNSKGTVVSGLYPSFNYYSCVPNNKLSEESDNSCVIMPHQPVMNGTSINQHSYQLPGQYGAIDAKELEWNGNS